MTLWKTTQVDLVAKSPTNEATLFMIEERAWGEDANQVDQLLAKLNTYYHYVMGSQLVSDFPDMAGLPVVIQLECATEPPTEIQKVIEAGVEGYAAYGIEFRTNVDPGLLTAP